MCLDAHGSRCGKDGHLVVGHKEYDKVRESRSSVERAQHGAISLCSVRPTRITISDSNSEAVSIEVSSVVLCAHKSN